MSGEDNKFDSNLLKEIGRDIQKIVMVILTIAILCAMIHVGNEINFMRQELGKARITIDEMKTKISNLTIEFQKGLKLRFW